jgi:hypothetical protein
MLMGVRMYANEQNARDAASKLALAELVAEENISVLTPESGGAADVVQKAIDGGELPSSYARLAVQALEKGQSIVSIPLPLQGAVALEIMDSCGALDVGPEPVQFYRDPAPLSDFFALPVLTSGKSRARLMTDNRIIFRSFLGLPLLSKGGSKDSSFGFPTLKKSASKNSSFGFPLLSKKGTPLSSMLGMKTLTGRKR